MRVGLSPCPAGPPRPEEHLSRQRPGCRGRVLISWAVPGAEGRVCVPGAYRGGGDRGFVVEEGRGALGRAAALKMLSNYCATLALWHAAALAWL